MCVKTFLFHILSRHLPDTVHTLFRHCPDTVQTLSRHSLTYSQGLFLLFLCVVLTYSRHCRNTVQTLSENWPDTAQRLFTQCLDTRHCLDIVWIISQGYFNFSCGWVGGWLVAEPMCRSKSDNKAISVQLDLHWTCQLELSLAIKFLKSLWLKLMWSMVVISRPWVG